LRLADAKLTLGDIELGGIDAESDHNLDEYFVLTPYVGAALRGSRTLFLGRKGSGKSALFRQLEKLVETTDGSSPIVVSLTPDQYAWAALRSYEEQGILPEQAHTNAWKLTLAIEVAAALVAHRPDAKAVSSDVNSALDVLARFLADNYGAPLPSLRKTATSLVKGLRQFNLSAFGFGVGMQRQVPESQAITPAVVSALYDLLSAVLGHQRVTVALDRLDDSWDGQDGSRSLLIGLIKALKELNDRFALRQDALRVLVFLRSDIYDSLLFDDKDKHRPTEQHIVWTPELLKELVDRRLPDGITASELFEAGEMRGSIAPFNYIVKRTFFRPREVLQFLAECIHQAGDHAVKSPKTMYEQLRNGIAVGR